MQNFLEHNSIYVVLAIVLVIWAGLVLYVASVDKKLRKVEKLVKENKMESVE